jgi:hypothetical protein
VSVHRPEPRAPGGALGDLPEEQRSSSSFVCLPEREADSILGFDAYFKSEFVRLLRQWSRWARFSRWSVAPAVSQHYGGLRLFQLIPAPIRPSVRDRATRSNRGRVSDRGPAPATGMHLLIQDGFGITLAPPGWAAPSVS